MWEVMYLHTIGSIDINACIKVCALLIILLSNKKYNGDMNDTNLRLIEEFEEHYWLQCTCTIAHPTLMQK